MRATALLCCALACGGILTEVAIANCEGDADAVNAEGTAQADDVHRVAEPEPEKVQVRGFLDVYYALNKNEPDSGENFYPGVGNIAKSANALAINFASVDVSRAPAPLGFHLIAGGGTELDVLHSGEPQERPWTRYLYQASALYAPGWGRGTVIEAGVYPGFIGFESPLARDNWNYTQGLAAQFTPSYETGLRATIPLGGGWNTELHVCRGWQSLGDVNFSESAAAKLGYDDGSLTLALNGWYGAERPDDDADHRRLIDAVVVIRPWAEWSFAAEGNAGRQESPQGGGESWWTGAIWARFSRTDSVWSLAARAEVLSDPDGAISGIPQRWEEGTMTFELRPVQHLMLRLEGRRDRSDADVFQRDRVLLGTQPLFVLAAIVTF